MDPKCLLSLNGLSSDCNGFFKTLLLPKDWHRPSDLDMRNQYLVIYLQYLFCLALVAYKAQIVYPAVDFL